MAVSATRPHSVYSRTPPPAGRNPDKQDVRIKRKIAGWFNNMDVFHSTSGSHRLSENRVKKTVWTGFRFQNHASLSGVRFIFFSWSAHLCSEYTRDRSPMKRHATPSIHTLRTRARHRPKQPELTTQTWKIRVTSSRPKEKRGNILGCLWLVQVESHHLNHACVYLHAVREATSYELGWPRPAFIFALRFRNHLVICPQIWQHYWAGSAFDDLVSF